jgi:hypothetical protein
VIESSPISELDEKALPVLTLLDISLAISGPDSFGGSFSVSSISDFE